MAPASMPMTLNLEGRLSQNVANRGNPSFVIFDLGGVLIDWNPRYLYRKLFADEAEMERFLSEVCTAHWNDEMDAGRSWTEAIGELVRLHPDQEANIQAFRSRWPEMLGGAFDDTVRLLETLHRDGTPLYALTNWSEETFELTRTQYPFLDYFRGIVVSGRERLRKPDPEIFRLLLKRYDIAPSQAVFIDDNAENVAAAAALGLHAIRFLSATALRTDLRRFGFAV